MRNLHVAWLISLLWMVATAGAMEPLTEGAEPPPARDPSERLSLPIHGKIAGKVTQTMDVPQYTYVEVDTGNGLVWAAGPVTTINVGDSVELSNGIQMIDFHSTILDRTFGEIYLVPAIELK